MLQFQVMQEEAKSTGKAVEDEPPSLKILAHNNLIGRIIGKQGATIKKVMEETGTKITVSSINDISSFNMERIITISGEIDLISRAEAEISSKLRVAYENDIQAMAVSRDNCPSALFSFSLEHCPSSSFAQCADTNFSSSPRA